MCSCSFIHSNQLYLVVLYYLYILINFQTLTTIFLHSSITKVMASSTPSAPINSSRGAADTTTGRIYFSTPSAQVRVPVGDVVFPPPQLMLTLYYLGEKLSGGLKIMRWWTIYTGRAQVAQKFEKKSEKCRAVPKIPYSKSLYIEPNYTLSSYIEPNYTLY